MKQIELYRRSRYDVIASGIVSGCSTQLSSYIHIPFLRTVLEQMEGISEYGVITLAHTKPDGDLTPLIHLSFVDKYGTGAMEETGILLSSCAPMPRKSEYNVLIEKFLENNSEWFEEFPRHLYQNFKSIGRSQND